MRGAVNRGLRRLQFELALDLSIPGGRPIRDVVARAADTAGADLLLVLPIPSGLGVTAVVRLAEEGKDTFLQVKTVDGGFAVIDEEDVDQTLLDLARASVEVLQRISADRAIREPLAAAAA